MQTTRLIALIYCCYALSLLEVPSSPTVVLLLQPVQEQQVGANVEDPIETNLCHGQN